jgi:hypothetical protein
MLCSLLGNRLSVAFVTKKHQQLANCSCLELKESLARMGSDLKQRIIESVKATWRSLHSFAQAHKSSSSAPQEEDVVVEREVDDVLTEMTIKSDDDETAACTCSHKICFLRHIHLNHVDNFVRCCFGDVRFHREKSFAEYFAD